MVLRLVAPRAVRLRADPLARRLARLDVEHWTRGIMLVPPRAEASHPPTPASAPRASTPAELSALASTAALLRTPLLGVLSGVQALPIATFASLGGGGVCIALEDAALAVTAPSHGLPLAYGESALLARLPRGLGAYLALTGSVLGAHELVHVGLARDHLNSRTLTRLTAALAVADDLDVLGGLDVPPATAMVAVGAHAMSASTPSPAELRLERRARARALALHCAMYGQAHEVSTPDGMAPRLAEIARLFDLGPRDAAGEVAKRLAGVPGEWAARALRAMATASPLGLELAARQLRAAAAAPSLGECLRTEARAHAAFDAHVTDGAALADEHERAATRGFGLQPWHVPFGAFARLDAPGAGAEPAGSPFALAAQIEEGARQAAATVDSWALEAR
ncbi:hypothetical protein KFE25_000237 [Diacronema lutheri]|uniref:3-hydroxyisobutyryl-CoA hydrolase n=3 Tax=Diacronema lutheri TaxID=2081491 RepID=A0A8J5XGI5_DIALT|nr:hypothetical protein KFE25_000237 [Diacronema lutheri]